MSKEQLANIFAFTAFIQGWMITHVIQKNTKAGSPPKKGWKLLKAVSKQIYTLPDFGITVLSSTNGKQSKKNKYGATSEENLDKILSKQKTGTQIMLRMKKNRIS